MRTSLARTVAVAAIVALVGLVANSAAAFITNWTDAAPWFAVPFAAVLVAMVQALVSALADGRVPTTLSIEGKGNRSSTGEGTPLALVIVVVIGLGVVAVAVTAGARYGVGWATGNETGPERLSTPAIGESGGLEIQVTSLQHTPHFTRAEVTVNNQTGVSVSLPLFGDCYLTGGDRTIAADDFRSDWTTTVAPGGRTYGVIIFSGHLPADATAATLAWPTVFPQGDGPKSLSVSLTLHPP